MQSCENAIILLYRCAEGRLAHFKGGLRSAALNKTTSTWMLER